MTDTAQSIVARERLIELERIERKVRALCAYYTPDDLAAHLSLAVAGNEVINEAGTVQKVWVNRKLVDSFRQLRKDLGLDNG